MLEAEQARAGSAQVIENDDANLTFETRKVRTEAVVDAKAKGNVRIWRTIDDKLVCVFKL